MHYFFLLFMKTPWGCVKQRASGELLYSTRSSAQSSVMTWRGGVGAGEAQEGGDSKNLTQHCKATILQFKKLKSHICSSFQL